MRSMRSTVVARGELGGSDEREGGTKIKTGARGRGRGGGAGQKQAFQNDTEGGNKREGASAGSAGSRRWRMGGSRITGLFITTHSTAHI